MTGSQYQVPPTRPDAVYPLGGSADVTVPWHYGDPFAEQKALVAGTAAVDLRHRGVVIVAGPDRLRWLNDLVSHKVDQLPPGQSALALILDPHGHVEHELHLYADPEQVWITTEPGKAAELANYLTRMQFLNDVKVRDVSDEFGSVWVSGVFETTEYPAWQPPAEFAGTGTTESGSDRGGGAARYVPGRPAHLSGTEVIVPLAEIDQFLAAFETLAGTWALEALRVAAAIPRAGAETDHRSLPHELGWIGTGVHLAKGCYRGQETVARVHNLGKPPRRLVLLHLDGSDHQLPAHGDRVLAGDREVGWIGTAVQHYELGPIATAIVKRNVDAGTEVTVEIADRLSADDSIEPVEPVTQTEGKDRVRIAATIEDVVVGNR